MYNKDFYGWLNSIDKETFSNYFYNHSNEDVAKHFNLSSSYFARIAQKHFKLAPKSKDTLDHIKKQKMEKNFGSLENAYAVRQEKLEQTNLSKFGVRYQTSLQEVQAKKAKTNLERYGVTAVAMNSEIRKRGEETKLAKYGYRTFNVEAAAQTKLERYGSTTYNNASKMQETKINKYGSSGFNNHEKSLSTKKAKYNDENYNNRTKANKTMIERYGVANSMQSLELRNKAKKRYTYMNIFFDSSWEIAFYIWALDNNLPIEHEPIKLKLKNNKGFYFPDFRIDDQLFEIKSSYWLKKASKEKRDAMFDNKVIVISDKAINFWLDYINSTYGKDYLKQFRNV